MRIQTALPLETRRRRDQVGEFRHRGWFLVAVDQNVREVRHLRGEFCNEPAGFTSKHQSFVIREHVVRHDYDDDAAEV